MENLQLFAAEYIGLKAEPVVNWTLGIVCVVVVAMLAYFYYKGFKNKAFKSKRRKLSLVLLTLLSVITIGANVAVKVFVNVIDTYFAPSFADPAKIDAAEKVSKALTTEIQEEGSVLLENKNNALPLAKNSKVNLFGISSVSITYGGSGSGSADESKNVTLQQGLKDAGIEVNDTLTQFYKDRLPQKEQTNIFSLNGGDYNLQEVAQSEYTDSVLKQAKDFSDTAIVVISRNGGEGGDLPTDMANYKNGTAGRHYLQLQEVEEQLLNTVKQNFKKVIVLVNSSNAMELGFLKDDGVSAALWIGGPGSTGLAGVGKILAGDVNPSGRLVDTYAYDLKTNPAFYTQGYFKYTNITYDERNYKGEVETKRYTFVNYNEGIYVGYRYYETRYVNNETGKTDESAYHAVVQYPFGYGLSYTNFKQSIRDMKEANGKIEVTVDVTNEGKVAGKDVSQVYYTAPYTVGGIEKSHVVLAGFAKTKVLQPGETQTVTISFDRDDMASYDYKNSKSYVLEAGDYQIKLMNNAHDVLDSRSFKVASTEVLKQRSSDKSAVTNQFDEANGGLVYVSRANWEGTLPTARPADKEASPEIAKQLDVKNPPIVDNASDSDIVVKNNGLKFKDLKGVDYNDPKWDQLLEQISVAEMKELISFGGYATREVASIDKPAVVDLDGPAGINGIFQHIKGVQYNSEVVVASTWNVELAQKMGEAFADEALAHGVVGLYAPAVNIHRQPFAGRNFEYYSEDPVVSGKIASGLVKAAFDKGVYTFTKHFALNDQETNRSGVATWANEQAIREVYLKAFEIPVKEGNATGIMSAFNRIGTTWAGGDSALLNTVLRDEWGFKGMVITDFAGASHMNPDQAIRNGNDLMLTPMGSLVTEKSTETNTGKQAMRKATKNILYTVVNSKALDVYKAKFKWWLAVLAVADVVLVALTAWGFQALTKKKKEELA